ncbi:MAG TPA: aquaporin, partial [Longimicrobiales bacterium]|nr:aquaporin [Longimicrobiales bacterium]
MGWRSFVAEGAGTLVVMFFGSLTVVAFPSSVLHESAGFALGLFAAGYAFGAVSHRHFNPAMSWAAYLDGRLTVRALLGSWLTQAAGGWRRRPCGGWRGWRGFGPPPPPPTR